MPESLPAVVVGECSLTFTFAPEASDGIPVTQMDSRDIYFLFLPRLKSLEEKGLKLINRLVTTCERDAACLFSYPLKPGTCICFEGILQAYLPQNSTGRPLSERFLSEVHVTAGLGLASKRDAFLQERVQRAQSSGAAVGFSWRSVFKALLVPRFDDEGTGMLQDSVLASALRHCHCGPSHTAVFGKPRCSGPKVRQLRLRGATGQAPTPR